MKRVHWNHPLPQTVCRCFSKKLVRESIPEYQESTQKPWKTWYPNVCNRIQRKDHPARSCCRWYQKRQVWSPRTHNKKSHYKKVPSAYFRLSKYKETYRTGRMTCRRLTMKETTKRVVAVFQVIVNLATSVRRGSGRSLNPRINTFWKRTTAQNQI